MDLSCTMEWLAVDLAPSDVCRQVNQGKTTFTENYRESGGKIAAAAFIRTEGSVCL